MFDHPKSKGAIPTLPIFNLMTGHSATAYTIGYLWFSLVGLVYSASLFFPFEINVLEYFETSDFFLASFKNINVFMMALLSVLYAIFVVPQIYIKAHNLIDKYSKSPDEKLSDTYKNYIKLKYILIMLSIRMIIIVLPLSISSYFGLYTAGKVKSGEGDKVYIKLNTRAQPIGGGMTDGSLFMIGAAGKFIFLYHHEKEQGEEKSVPLIIPMSVISTVLVENDKNREFLEKLPEQPAQNDSELDSIKKRLNELEAIDHQGMQRDIESLLRKVACGRLSGGQLLGKVGEVYFKLDSDSITESEQQKLKCRLSSLPEGSNLTVMAFADRSGDSEYNRDLSLRRAIAVRNFIMTLGVENVAIISSVDGLGEEGAPVQTKDGEQEPCNRVTFIYRTGPDPSSGTKGESPSACGDSC